MPRSWPAPSLPLLTGEAVERIVFVSTILLAGAFAAFHWQLTSGAPPEQARTIAVNAFVAAQIVYLINCRSLDSLRPQAGFLGNPWLPAGIGTAIVPQMLFTHTPTMNALFRTAPIG